MGLQVRERGLEVQEASQKERKLVLRPSCTSREVREGKRRNKFTILTPVTSLEVIGSKGK